MIEKIPSTIDLQTGEYKGVEFDIIPKKTFAMVCRKVNELVDAVNEIMTWRFETDEPEKLEQTQPADTLVLEEELSRTRKALDFAVDALKWISETFYLGEEFVAPVGERCEFALEQIKELEQKDVK